jgi:hypothetical protein
VLDGNRIDFIETREEITTSYDPGTTKIVQQHDGSVLRLRKLGEDYDPSDKVSVMKRIQAGRRGPDRPALCRSDAERPARQPEHRRRAAQHAERPGALPGYLGARQDQRQPALSAATSFTNERN